jgi:hypothetical protein
MDFMIFMILNHNFHDLDGLTIVITNTLPSSDDGILKFTTSSDDVPYLLMHHQMMLPLRIHHQMMLSDSLSIIR